MAPAPSKGLVDWLREFLPRVGGPAAYVTAVACVGGGALLRLPLDYWAGAALPPYITFSPAVVIAGFLGGIRAGFLACALSIGIAWYFWIVPYQSWRITTIRDLLTVGVYVVTGSLMAFVSGSARLLLERVQASEIERSRVAKETVHRIKNLVAVVHALSRQTSKQATSMEEYREQFEARLMALGLAQDMLVANSWEPVPLDRLVDAALAAFRDHSAIVVAPGPPTLVPASLVSGLSMALYELGTNALKYGALASVEGRVSVSWSCQEARCKLTWQESGIHRAPARSSAGSGFGTSLIRNALAGHPDTRIEYAIQGDSVFAAFDWPAAYPPALQP